MRDPLGGDGGGTVDLGALLFDLDERALTGATIVGGRMTVWPDQSGNGNDAVLDPDDGSDDDNGFLVSGGPGVASLVGLDGATILVDGVEIGPGWVAPEDIGSSRIAVQLSGLDSYAEYDDAGSLTIYFGPRSTWGPDASGLYGFATANGPFATGDVLVPGDPTDDDVQKIPAGTRYEDIAFEATAFTGNGTARTVPGGGAFEVCLLSGDPFDADYALAMICTNGGPTRSVFVGGGSVYVTATAEYADGDSSLDTRLTVPVDLSGPHTIYTLVVVGVDTPGDGTEQCPLTFDPADTAIYSDWYITSGDPHSYVNAYEIGANVGGPQAGDCIINVETRTGDDGDPLMVNHVDGFAAFPQTAIGPGNSDNFYPSPSGVMIANYPAGGFCASGRWMRVLCYAGVHDSAQRATVRRRLHAQAAAVGLDATLYADSNPFVPDVADVLPDSIVAGDLTWTERWDAEAEPPADDGTNVTSWAGLHGTVLTADGDALPVSAATTPSGRAAITWPANTAGRLISDPLTDLGWIDATGTFVVVLRSPGLNDFRPVIADATDVGGQKDHFGSPWGGFHGLFFYDTAGFGNNMAITENHWAVVAISVDTDVAKVSVVSDHGFGPHVQQIPCEPVDWRLARFLIGGILSTPNQAGGVNALEGDVAFVGYRSDYLNEHDLKVIVAALVTLEGI